MHAWLFKGDFLTSLALVFRLGLKAADANDFLIYDKAHGQLYYDRDGNGAAAQVLFADLKDGVTLTVGDFVLI
jgi:serralysin